MKQNEARRARPHEGPRGSALRCGPWAWVRNAKAASGVCAAALAGLTSASAWAADDVETVTLEFHADAANCPDKADFLRSVQAQTRSIRIAEHDESTRTFRVLIRGNAGEKVRGEFSLVDAEVSGRTSATRTIWGETCKEVFEALALFVALSVDSESPTSAVSRAHAKPHRSPRRERPAPSSDRRAASTVTPTWKQESAGAAPVRRQWRGTAGIHVGMMSAGAASMLPFAAPFIEASLRPIGGGSSLSPALRLGFSSSATSSSQTSYGAAQLRWTMLRSDACPIDLQALRALFVRPCFTGTVGVLRGTGVGIAEPNTRHLAWSTLGALLRVEWTLGDVFSIEASGAMDLPLRRDAFHFERELPLYRVPRALGTATIGVATHFL
jgi:hypothetical protein